LGQRGTAATPLHLARTEHPFDAIDGGAQDFGELFHHLVEGGFRRFFPGDLRDRFT
jgi:hypothetical protein